jgi:hypothetical protein
MASQIFEDSQQCAETQLDVDSQDPAALDVPLPLDKPGDNLLLVGVGVGGVGVPPCNRAEEVAKAERSSKRSVDCAPTASIATLTRLPPPTSAPQRLGQRDANAWAEMPRKYRGVMNYACHPAARHKQTHEVKNTDGKLRIRY